MISPVRLGTTAWGSPVSDAGIEKLGRGTRRPCATILLGFATVASIDPEGSMRRWAARTVAVAPGEDSGNDNGNVGHVRHTGLNRPGDDGRCARRGGLPSQSATPWGVFTVATVWIAMGILNFLVVWKLMLRWTFRAFQYTFLFVLIVAFPVMANPPPQGGVDSSAGSLPSGGISHRSGEITEHLIAGIHTDR